jgi:SAM-dependent methyltransferase
LTFTGEGISLRFHRLSVSLRSSHLSSFLAGLPERYPRSYLKEIKLDRLLMGGEMNLSSASYARAIGDLLWPSRPIAESPHAKLLVAYRAKGEDLFLPDQIEATWYYKNAANCIEVYGQYLEAKDPKEIVGLAKVFCQRFNAGASDQHRLGHSEKASFVTVRRIRFSDCYEIIDGHHRLAAASVSGAQKYRCVVIPSEPVLTPIQQMILDESNFMWGQHMLYQPISVPEVGTWPILRQCSDRLAMMERFLTEKGISSGSYLDICCSYGWFISEMTRRGFLSFGVDRDKAAVSVGRLVYGLEDTANAIADANRFLDKRDRRYDIVSCFSVLHHIVLQSGLSAAAEFIRKVDAVTGRVLFFDMGECHEGWFNESLEGWNSEFIKNWLKEHTSFSQINILGADADNVGLHEKQYGRHLFACSRRE